MRNRMGSSLNLDTTVVGLQGFPISTTAPTSGQALVFDGTNWVPSDVAAGGHFVPQLDPTNDVAVSSLGGPGGGPLISAFENPVSPDADFLAIRTQRDVDGTAIFLRGPTFPDPSAANGLQMWLGDGGNLLFNFTNTGQLNLPAMPVNPMDAIPKQYFDDALASLPPPSSVGSAPPASPGNGDLWFNTNNNTLNVWNGTAWVPVAPSTPVSLSGTQVPIVYFFPGKPAASQIIRVPIAVPINIAALFAGSQSSVGTNPTASAVFNVLVNGASVGTATVSTAGAVTWTGSALAVTVGQVLEMQAPATQDATLADVAFTILATRT